jgi:hypothetical protein
MVKAGFVFGGKGGKGVATCRTRNGWSAPAFITISGGSWGLQIGVEAVDLVMIIQNEKGMQKLLSSNFQLGADASAAAGPIGRHASAGTDWKLDTEILTYSRAKGAFAGLTLEGASIRQDDDSRRAIYGRKVTTRELLLGRVPAPSAARRRSLRKFAEQKPKPWPKGKLKPNLKPKRKSRSRTCRIGLPLFVMRADFVCSSGGTVPSLPSCSVRAKQIFRGRWMRFIFRCSQMSTGG